MPVRHALQVIVVGVLCHTAVEECPRQVVHGFLLVLYRLGDDLRGEVIVKTVVQMALWEGVK